MSVYSDKIFKNPIKIIKAFNNSEFKAAFNEIEKLRKKYFLLGYIRYEAKEIFLNNQIQFPLPLLYFEVYETYEKYLPQTSQDIKLKITPQIHFSEYSTAIEKIKNEIKNGNTYEVNYTYDFEIENKSNHSNIEIYEHFLSEQKTPYNTFIENEYETLLSFSPELFFELEGNHITTKPMKGTIKRGKTEKEDLQLKTYLQQDEKNRSENVMIVDLLRNDLGRIAQTGSVKVTKLFEIETHKTLHQMTSQIEADLKEDTTLYDIFNAIFPCGSITGAPKISTMQIIDSVEFGKRGIYCGAIGLITPQSTTFSVPIRILQKPNNQNKFQYRVGGAVVWDSTAQDEWEETYTKIKFLNNQFQIVETMKFSNGKILFEKEHLERMKHSASQLGFTYNTPDIKIPDSGDGIIRILLDKDGTFSYEIKTITDSKTNIIEISPIKVSSKNKMLYHKTSYRPWFVESYKRIREKEIYDEIFFNEKGELTEGARSNIILELNGKFYTPPISCGLLNGIYRQKLINEGYCTEKILYRKDLLKAENIYCINSVRGIKKVQLKEEKCKI